MQNTIIDYSLIGKRIQKQRKSLNITQEQLAEDLHLSVFYVSKIENGKCTPTLETLALIAEHLKLELGYLITGASMLKDDYYTNQLSEITSKATKKELELIIKLAKAVLCE